MNTLGALIAQFSQKLQKGFVVGPFSKTSDPGMIEAMGHAGFDFVIIDMEHGPTGVESAQNLIRAAVLSGLLPIVRVKEGCLHVVGEVLDIGAGGVQAPQVACGDDVKALIRAARFHPEGQRGVCRFVRAADYSAMDRFEYFKRANEALLIVQLEGQEALDNIDGILEAGPDVVFIGPYDLSQSLGVPGQIGHPAVQEKMREIVRRGEAAGIMVGTFVDTLEDASKWRAAGVKYLAYSVDMGIMYEASRTICAALRPVDPSGPPA